MNRISVAFQLRLTNENDQCFSVCVCPGPVAVVVVVFFCQWEIRKFIGKARVRVTQLQLSRTVSWKNIFTSGNGK